MSGRRPEEPEPEEATQGEIRAEATQEGEDPVTRREALETDLMDKGESEAGEEIGEPTP
jgi:hypothetical protein